MPCSPAQVRALRLKIREILFGGARGGGKSETGTVWLGNPACGAKAHGAYRGLVVRENYTDLIAWLDHAADFYEGYGAAWSGMSQTFSFPSGAKIRAGHLDGPCAYKKYQGHEYQRILIEELTQIAREMDYLKLLGSCRSKYPELYPSVFCTANPGGKGHGWVRKRFISPAPPGTPIFDPGGNRIYLPSTAADNPFLGPEYWQYLKSLPDNLRRAWLDGDWDVLAGQFFPEFRESIHTCPPIEIPEHWERHISIDWGYNHDPYAIIFYAISESGIVFVTGEMTGTHTIPADVAARYLAVCPEPYSAIGDPSMWAKFNSPDSTAIQMQQAGAYNLSKGNNERIQGWTRVHEYLHRRKLMIFSTCRNIINNLPAMIHDEKNPEDAQKDSAIDHFPDSLRYFLMSRPLPTDPPKEEIDFVDDKSRRAHEAIQKLKKVRKKAGW